MLDCAARLPDAHQPAIGNGYYPGFIYTQPTFTNNYPVKPEQQSKDYIQSNGSICSSGGSPTHYPHSPVDSSPDSHPSSQSPGYNSSPHHLTPTSNPYYYPYNNSSCVKSYPPLQHKDISAVGSGAVPQQQYTSKSDISLPLYTHQNSLSPNSIHGGGSQGGSPSSGSGGSLSNSPSPLTDTKPAAGLYWPAPAAIPPQYGSIHNPAAVKQAPSPADYGMFQHLHHQGMSI